MGDEMKRVAVCPNSVNTASAAATISAPLVPWRIGFLAAC